MPGTFFLTVQGNRINIENLSFATENSVVIQQDTFELIGLKDIREAAEKKAIVETLVRCDGNISQSAKELKIDRKWLMKKMTEFELDANAYRDK